MVYKRDIFQPLTQNDTLRQVGDVLVAIKFECEKKDQQLAQHAQAIFTCSTTTTISSNHSCLSVVMVDDRSIF
jgi:hypothetical protein